MNFQDQENQDQFCLDSTTELRFILYSELNEREREIERVHKDIIRVQFYTEKKVPE